MFTQKRYVLELVGALALYGVLLFGANALEAAVRPAGAMLVTISLLPMVGALAAAWAIMRALWRMDELQRRIQLDAIAMAFLGTALVTFGWGFAEGAGLPQLRAFAVWPVMASLWVVGLLIAQRRYR